jgi:uncharacterized protein with von Willebrand factor type A (vWA) domain
MSTTPPPPSPSLGGGALVRVVLAFADQLRTAGVDVPTSGVVDAVAALAQVDLASRAEMRVALGTTLVKRSEDLVAFEAAFERWFATASATVEPGDRADADGAGEDAAIREQLARALAGGDATALPALAARAVRRWAGLGSAPGSDRYHLQRVRRGLDLSGIRQDALRLRRGGDRGTVVEERLAQADIEALLERFRRLLAAEVRTGRTGRVGPAAPVIERPDEIDFLGASTLELREMRAAVRPLARKLAARVAHRQRRSRGGRLDMRRTLRGSLQSGGVPLDPAYRHRPRTRPELWVVCDISGSMAEFSRFTLTLVYALHEELSGLRTFVFVDDVREITDVLDRRLHDVDPYSLLVRASAARARHRSDYGRALRQLLDQHGSELGPRATLVVTGDARSHHGDPGLDALREIHRRSRRVWFLNPEPRERWDQGDSVASLYTLACDHMAEVRNLRQLVACVTELV